MDSNDAQPTPALSFTQFQIPCFELLTLNERENSIAQTVDISMNPNTKERKKKYINKQVKQQKSFQSDRMKVKNKKRIEYLQDKIQQLEKENASLRRLYQCCPNCRYSISKRQFEDQIVMLQQSFTNNVAGQIQKKANSRQSIQFQKIDFTTPISFNPEMQQKSWIYLGIMMIVMGSKNLDVDGTTNVFRILKQAVDQIRRQVQKCQEKITLDFYQMKEDLNQSSGQIPGIDFDPFISKQQCRSLHLDGVRVQSVQQFQLIYDRKVSFWVKYQSLLTIMEYIKDCCWFN